MKPAKNLSSDDPPVMPPRKRFKNDEGGFRQASENDLAQSTRSLLDVRSLTISPMPQYSAGATSEVTVAPNSASEPLPSSPNIVPVAIKDTWADLERFLQVLTTSSSRFGQLKQVIENLADAIAMYEDAIAAQCDSLKTELDSLFSTLSTHFSGNAPPTMTAIMGNLCGAIEKELDHISTKQDAGTEERHWEAKKDVNEVMDRYRRIRGHLDRLTLNADLITWMIVDNQATEARLDKLKPSMSACYNSSEAAQIVKADIEIYLQAELEGVSVSESQMSQLVERAGVLFIYAATAVRYIKAKSSPSGQQGRLNVVLNASSSASSNKNRDIDALYSVVLASAFSNPDLEEDDIVAMRLVLHTVVCAQEPLKISSLGGLLQLEDGGSVQDALEPLWSVVHVSDSGEDSLVTTLHTSFPDYMLDPDRSKEYVCVAKSHHGRLAELCFARIQTNERQFNICQLESSYVPDEQISGLDERVKQAVPSDLAYACHYWAMHLELGGSSIERLKLLDEFLSTRLLLWMEVLNLEKRMNLGPILLDKAKQWCRSLDSESDTKDLVNDAWRFATTFAANTISHSTPHLYVSMLTCWPNSRVIAKRYTPRTNRLVKITGRAMEWRELALLGIIHAGCPIRSAAFSPDGTRIVSGSSDNTIQIWDGQTGQMVLGPLHGHTNEINSVVFSPNGMRIASGSWDATIRVWDGQTGQSVLGPLQGHTGFVYSVAFSPDSMRIVSGFFDETIRVWDARTGEIVLGPLQVHTGPAHSVAFSPNGMRIVSGSSNIIQVWDAQTGQMVLGPLHGHTSSISSVAFSPDSMRIVSGSIDQTIGLWDGQTGEMVLGPLQGHASPVTPVAFSPDGVHIASGCWDKTIRVWDGQTGQMVLGPLEGHTSSVSSVAFSPDGMSIVSGSHDNTIRTWSTRSLVHMSSMTSTASIPQTQTAMSPFHAPFTWQLQSDGWVVDEHRRLLFWVPHDLRHRLLVAPNTLLISTRGSAQLNLEDAAIGESWMECYRPA